MRPQLKQLVECLKLLIERFQVWYHFKTTPEQEERFIEWVRYPKEVETISLPVVTSAQTDITQTDTQRIDAINAAQARELQRYIDSHKPQSAHYEPPERVTGPIRPIRLQRIQTEEMRVAFPVVDTDKWLVT